MEKKPRVVAIVGPTASGKTALSLSLSKRLKGEVVACDSRTIYKYMDIGTAKPTADEQRAVRHHMIDVAEPDQTYTAAQYKEEAGRAIEEIVGRGALPVVCGGTGFYARALLEGIQIPEVAPQEELRRQLNEFADREGNQALHQRLAELDPRTAERLNVNDRFRLVRALEVSIVTGKAFSQLATRTDEPYETLWIGLTVENRQLLKERIKERFAEQMDQGLLAEVQFLLNKYGPTRTIKNAVPYRDLIRYLSGELTLAEAWEECLKHNFQLARRQIMWFRANQKTNWYCLENQSSQEILEDVLHKLES